VDVFVLSTTVDIFGPLLVRGSYILLWNSLYKLYSSGDVAFLCIVLVM
jgi:hypothetical protein